MSDRWIFDRWIRVARATAAGLTLFGALGASSRLSQAQAQDFIAFHSNRGGSDAIFIMNSDGSGVREITADAFDDAWLSVSPDGKRIAFETYPGGKDPQFAEIAVVDIATGDVKVLTNNHVQDSEPDWLSNDTIVYESHPQGTGILRSLNVADGTTQDLVSVPGTWLGWPSVSPDGKTIALLGAPGDKGPYNLYTVPATGGPLKQITEFDFNVDEARWSPDGSRLIFAADKDEKQYDLFTIAADGTDLQQLTNSPANELRPDFSPDGTRIVYESDLKATYDIYTMKLDGSDVQQLTRGKKDNESPRWWGPRGARSGGGPNEGGATPGAPATPSAEAGQCADPAATALLADASTALGQGDFDSAIKILSDAIKKDAKCADAYFMRGKAYLARDGSKACGTAYFDLTSALRLKYPDQPVAQSIKNEPSVAAAWSAVCSGSLPSQ